MYLYFLRNQEFFFFTKKLGGNLKMNFSTLPKIELHCHLDGSLRPKTIIDIAKREGIRLPSMEIDEHSKRAYCANRM